MLIEIPDEFEVSTKDFETMTLVLAKFLMMICTREKYKVYLENNPELGTVTAKKEYITEKLDHNSEPVSGE